MRRKNFKPKVSLVTANLITPSVRNMAQQTSLLAWGENNDGQLGLGYESKFEYPPKQIENVGDIVWSQIESGTWHTVALSSNGEVFIWGWVLLGHDDRQTRCVPTKVDRLSGESIIKVACGGSHTAALTAAGKLFTWYVRRHET